VKIGQASHVLAALFADEEKQLNAQVRRASSF
jgi:hypothetical protein